MNEMNHKAMSSANSIRLELLFFVSRQVAFFSYHRIVAEQLERSNNYDALCKGSFILTVK